MRCRDTVAIEPKRIRSAGAALHRFFRRSQPSLVPARGYRILDMKPGTFE
jgi:hypothetical protein